MPKIKGAVEQRSIKHNTNIDLSTAENWLIRPELIELCRDAITQQLEAQHFSYPRGFSGDPDLLDAYASFFNRYFNPHVTVLPSHLSTAPGAMACIDALLYNICDPGDGILVPGPYWNGFDFGMRVRSSVNPVAVDLPSFQSNFTDELLPSLEEAYISAKYPIKALMICNPHNPLGLYYPRAVLEGCIQFCKRHGIHFISDEVYALTSFDAPDLAEPREFVSALSLDLDKLGADKSRVHVIWSTSKDFGQSGFRMGCTVTQFNEEMAVALALAANTQISALSTIFVTNLLTSPKLPSLIALNSQRLSIAYQKLTSFFKENQIPYIPCNAGLYVFAKMATKATSWDEESDVVGLLKGAGVLVSPGKAYHGPEKEKGWMRVGFSVKDTDLEKAIQRIRRVVENMRRYERKDSLGISSKRSASPPIEVDQPVKRVKISAAT
ncbi:uncharacterized protein N0V89_001737 [Didymosphaeria variabile]|uniref:Aminotransferase class I/classII large domain-containing protein n=1 Tax=Didymosphaeria variabile TaxID=1932322 RepID=A0A9W8XQC0_9PLEO|nr:uncharacterized protein N0V89_001737 [Didymosphaeria variabile]KAJ4357162.1 hypothetical protein N0V89_001737 [Didymosphaeria variabile]